MHAIIRQGNGKYYISYVFGFYEDIGDELERNHSYTRGSYWIVWNEEKTRLIKWLDMVPNTQFLITQTLIIEGDIENWIINEDGTGCVDFLSKELLDSLLISEHQPEDILEKCRSIDSGYSYSEIQEVKTQNDAENLRCVSGGFHDAFIATETMQEDGSLYLRFDGTWGCEIEVWFWGELEYNTSSRNPEECDPCWGGSTIILQDGFVYLVDDEDMTIDQIGPGYCYFKARNMKYRVIPD